mmetsp:Transcript_31599/g.111240  ORF Transcript_31599/g.111240 Transcript_31599/m.111240 type:complete len:503 (-) Transcript_31599:24-1532(-)
MQFTSRVLDSMTGQRIPFEMSAGSLPPRAAKLPACLLAWNLFAANTARECSYCILRDARSRVARDVESIRVAKLHERMAENEHTERFMNHELKNRLFALAALCTDDAQRALVCEMTEMNDTRGVIVRLKVGRYEARLEDVDLASLVEGRLRPYIVANRTFLMTPITGFDAHRQHSLRLDSTLMHIIIDNCLSNVRAAWHPGVTQRRVGSQVRRRAQTGYRGRARGAARLRGGRGGERDFGGPQLGRAEARAVDYRRRGRIELRRAPRRATLRRRHAHGRGGKLPPRSRRRRGARRHAAPRALRRRGGGTPGAAARAVHGAGGRRALGHCGAGRSGRRRLADPAQAPGQARAHRLPAVPRTHRRGRHLRLHRRVRAHRRRRRHGRLPRGSELWSCESQQVRHGPRPRDPAAGRGAVAALSLRGVGERLARRCQVVPLRWRRRTHSQKHFADATPQALVRPRSGPPQVHGARLLKPQYTTSTKTEASYGPPNKGNPDTLLEFKS